MRELLSEYGFNGDETPIVLGSALCALEDRNPEIGEESIKKLMDAVDSYIPTPKRDLEKPFLMSIEDVFSIAGRGTVATGSVERGFITKGAEVEIVGFGATIKTTITGVEMFHKGACLAWPCLPSLFAYGSKLTLPSFLPPPAHPHTLRTHTHTHTELDRAEAGDNAGLLLRGLKRDQLKRGQVMVAPGTVTPHNKFLAQFYILTKEEGGRHTPFVENYQPQLFSRTMDINCSVNWPETPAGIAARNEGKMIMPGDNLELLVTLRETVAIEEGLRFTIREGGKTVGTGVVTKILE